MVVGQDEPVFVDDEAGAGPLLFSLEHVLAVGPEEEVEGRAGVAPRRAKGLRNLHVDDRRRQALGQVPEVPERQRLALIERLAPALGPQLLGLRRRRPEGRDGGRAEADDEGQGGGGEGSGLRHGALRGVLLGGTVVDPDPFPRGGEVSGGAEGPAAAGASGAGGSFMMRRRDRPWSSAG